VINSRKEIGGGEDNQACQAQKDFPLALRKRGYRSISGKLLAPVIKVKCK